MSPPIVELDFFAIEKDSSSSSSASSASSSTKSQFQKFLQSQRSFRGAQTSAISKINPQLLKSLICTSPAGMNRGFENGDLIELKEDRRPPLIPSMPVCASFLRSGSENIHETAPLTIFYNETVAVFDVPRKKAESILRLAEEGISKANAEKDHTKVAPSSAARLLRQQQLLNSLRGDFPIARRKSLQRFLEKRRERLTMTSPYHCCHSQWKLGSHASFSNESRTQ